MLSYCSFFICTQHIVQLRDDDDDDNELFLRNGHQQKALSLSPSWNHCQKFSPSQIFSTLRVPDLNLRRTRVQGFLNEAAQY